MKNFDGRTISQLVMGCSALAFVGLALAYPQLNAIANYNTPSPPPPPPPPPPMVIQQPTRVPTFTPSVVVPTDVTNNIPNTNLLNPGNPMNPVSGLASIDPGKVPAVTNLKGSTDFILVKSKTPNDFDKVSPYAVKINNGGVLLVGVRKPSETGMVVSDIGNVAIFSNAAGADVMVSFKNGILRIMNLDGLGENVRLALTGSQFADLSARAFTIKPGYELVASGSALTRRDLRPGDGISRRGVTMIGNKHVAIAQFSVESVLKGSDLIASMNQTDSGSKEKRILADMSKMAAVLNQVNGNYGFDTGKEQTP